MDEEEFADEYRKVVAEDADGVDAIVAAFSKYVPEGRKHQVEYMFRESCLGMPVGMVSRCAARIPEWIKKEWTQEIDSAEFTQNGGVALASHFPMKIERFTFTIRGTNPEHQRGIMFDQMG